VALGALLLLAWLAAPARAAVPLPGGTTVSQVDFERHVMGVFGRMGCNSGSCHGSFQGKGGLQLSLFGYDPEMDYQALTRQVQGRRINTTDPDQSLLLLKATGQVPHGGATRFGRSSWAYALLREWIANGAKWQKGSGEARAVRAVPSEYAVTRAGQEGQLRIQAEFQDGTTEDITPLCDYRTNDDAVVEVSPLGKLKTLRPGDTAIVVSYRGHVLPVRVMVPASTPPGFRYPDLPMENFIDREVFTKLKRLNMVPSEPAGDAEFLRRVTLDTIGSLPSPDEVRTFLADKRADKRARKIDELLAHPRHAALWATKFSDITGNNTDALENPQQRKPRLSQMWHDWFRKRVAENMPYDQIVHGVLCATSREGRSPEEYIKEVEANEDAQDRNETTKYADRATLDLYWRMNARVPLEQWGEKTAAAFLGVRLECAQCHKHPFDRWTQIDYRSYANVFGPVVFGISPDSTKPFRDANVERNKRSQNRTPARTRLPVAPLREVFIAGTGGSPARGGTLPLLTHPDTRAVLTPRAPGGPEIQAPPGKDPREALFEWMRSPENPFFARSFANRVWGHYFGVGIVHPVDDFSLANPPSNEKLLDALAREFIHNKYDIRALERAILNSRTYQLNSTPNETNRFDRNNYARSYVRPLMAEVVLDMLNDACGVQERWAPTDGAPPDARAIEVGTTRLQAGGMAAYAFRVFGRPPRSTACDCERAMEPALPQKLFLMADPNLMAKLRAPGNRLATLLAKEPDDDRALDELVLGTLGRLPTEQERAWFNEHKKTKKLPAGGARASGAARQEVFADTLWALVNTTEFIFNH
jgi:hypothetical protein